ncbi:hypothetical protein GGI21_001356, partial [Coemansia aciculifera]
MSASKDTDSPLLFSGDGLSGRLEFSISLSMLNSKPMDEKSALLPSPPLRIQSQVKRKSLRNLIHAHVRRPEVSPRAAEAAAAVIKQADMFNLPLPKLPSPIASS